MKHIRFLLIAFVVYYLCILFSGDASSRMSVMTLGILPYISAAIFFLLLTAALERLKKEGQAGQRKIQQYIRYSTFGLATLQAIGMYVGLVI